MSQERLLVCPVCRHKNETNATQCVKCGIVLEYDYITRQVDGSKAPDNEVPAHRYGILNDGMVLYIAGHPQPLIVRGRTTVVLGRRVDADSEIVDLSKYDAALKGVSRRHARITIDDDGAVIEDLASTNGTWLNEVQLAPNDTYIISNGDRLRLGLLVSYVYFAGHSTKQVIVLRDRVAGEFSNVDEQVKMYIDAVFGLQVVINLVLGRDAAAPVMSSVVPDNATGKVKVAIEGAMDAVQLIQDNILPWRVSQQGLTQVLEIEDENERRAELHELAYLLLQTGIADNLGLTVTPDHVNQLLPHLEVLVLGSVELVLGG